MFTRIARIETETSLPDLARSLYRVPPGAGGQNLLERAERLLLAANPGLVDQSGFVFGRRVRVPQIEGLTLTQRAELPGSALGDLAGEATARLGQIAARLEDGSRAAAERREQAIARAESDAVIEQVREALPGGDNLLRVAIDAMRRNAELENERIAALDRAILAAGAAFQRLGDRLPDNRMNDPDSPDDPAGPIRRDTPSRPNRPGRPPIAGPGRLG